MESPTPSSDQEPMSVLAARAAKSTEGQPVRKTCLAADADADRPAVVYAKGMTPTHRDDVEMILGGDDFAEFIPFGAVADILTGETGAQIAKGRTGSLIIKLIYSDFSGEWNRFEMSIKLNAVRAKKVA